ALGGYLPGEPETYEDALADVQSRREGIGYYAGMPLGFASPAGLAATAGQAVARQGGSRLAQYGTTALASGIEGAAFAAGDADPGERLAAVPAGAAIGAVAGVAGQRIGETLTSRLERRLARDIDRLDEMEVARLQGLGREQGVDLTPAELTGLPSLKQDQKRLGQLPQTADDVGDFYKGRNETQIDPAIERFLGGISDIEGDEAAGELARAAATRASDTVAKNRAAKAAPIYQKAFAEAGPVDTSPVAAKIAELGRTAPEGGEVSRSLAKASRLVGSNADLPTLHGAKLELDQMIEGANLSKKLGSTTKAKMVEVKNALVSQLDEASPDYAKARATFADLSPGVQRVREGVTGTIAELPDQQLRTAANRLFGKGKISPRAAGEAKRQLQAADPDAWQAIKRGFMEEQWLKAQKEMVDGDAPNRGAKFRQTLLGDKKQRQILQATLEEDEFQALTDLGDVLEATGRVKRVGSDTAMNQEAQRLAQENAESPLAGVLSMMNADILPNIAKRWTNRRLIGQSEDMVKAITSPDGISLIKELKRVQPSEKLVRAIIGQYISQAASKPAAALAAQTGEKKAEAQAAAPAESMQFDFERDADGRIIGAKRR
ncbi:MAG: hypothetical protein ACR2RE_02180, partial [Geminicoccaceae bacterium]